MAVDDINSNRSQILTSHLLKLDINDGKCEADVVMKRFIDIIKTKDAHRFRSTVGMLGNKIFHIELNHTLIVFTKECTFTRTCLF